MTFLLLLCFAFIFCLYCYYKDEGFFLFTTGDFLLRKYGDAKLLITPTARFLNMENASRNPTAWFLKVEKAFCNTKA